MNPRDDRFASDVASDFLIRGTREPWALARPGRKAIAIALRLSRVHGRLRRDLDGLLRLSYVLEGRMDAPGAARDVRTAMLAVEGVAAELGLARTATAADLRPLAKAAVRKVERARDPSPARAQPLSRMIAGRAPAPPRSARLVRR